MSTRPDPLIEDERISPYAPRWVRDPSYQVLREAETLKRRIRNPDETEPAPSVPCAEPDLPHSFPEFIKRRNQPVADDLSNDNIDIPTAPRPLHPHDPDPEWDPWPDGPEKKWRGRKKPLLFTLAVSVAAGCSYLLVWKPSPDPAADAMAQTVRAAAAPATTAVTHAQDSKRVRTVQIISKSQERLPLAAAQTTTDTPAPAAKPSDQITPTTRDRGAAQGQARAPLAPSAAATPADATASQPETHNAAAATTVAPAAAANAPEARLDRETVALLIKRGAQFIDAGDFASARVVLRRAAESGNPDAALAMAATYDPAALKRLGVKGLAPDAEKARLWYEKARQLGSQEAPQLLERLAKLSN